MKDLFKTLHLKDAKKHHYILTALLAIFVVFPISIPEQISVMVDTTVGKVVIILAALNLFFMHPMVGSLGLLAAYELIKRSEHTVIKNPTHRFLPSEAKKTANLNQYNQFPVTVEEMVIAKQIPYVFNTTAANNSSYKPVQGKLQGAAKL
jgi:hypothetical protein